VCICLMRQLTEQSQEILRVTHYEQDTIDELHKAHVDDFYSFKREKVIRA